MGRSVKQQIKSGLRLGGGLAVFFLAMAPLVDGLRRVVWAAPPHQLVWSPIGWAELIVAAALMVSTATMWMQWAAGCMLFASIKGAFMLTMGGPIPRSELALPVIFSVASLVLMGSIALRGTTVLDRIALTFYVFCIAWRADKGLFMADTSLAVGLGVLFASWCVDTGVDLAKNRSAFFTGFRGAFFRQRC
jgi:hypothetical protein